MIWSKYHLYESTYKQSFLVLNYPIGFIGIFQLLGQLQQPLLQFFFNGNVKPAKIMPLSFSWHSSKKLRSRKFENCNEPYPSLPFLSSFLFYSKCQLKWCNWQTCCYTQRVITSKAVKSLTTPEPIQKRKKQ